MGRGDQLMQQGKDRQGEDEAGVAIPDPDVPGGAEQELGGEQEVAEGEPGKETAGRFHRRVLRARMFVAHHDQTGAEHREDRRRDDEVAAEEADRQLAELQDELHSELQVDRRCAERLDLARDRHRAVEQHMVDAEIDRAGERERREDPEAQACGRGQQRKDGQNEQSGVEPRADHQPGGEEQPHAVADTRRPVGAQGKADEERDRREQQRGLHADERGLVTEGVDNQGGGGRVEKAADPGAPRSP